MEDKVKIQERHKHNEPLDFSKGYKTYISKTVTNDLKSFIENCDTARAVFEDRFGKKADTTWDYDKYNIFVITCNSLLFYNLYKELRDFIRDYIGDDRPLWIQSWLNYHKSDQVLKKHHHSFTYHGYISIDPKDTTTVFKNFEIKNLPGQVYIGPGGKEYEHSVRVDKPYDGNRITLGFDISPIPNLITLNQGFIPLI